MARTRLNLPSKPFKVDLELLKSQVKELTGKIEDVLSGGAYFVLVLSDELADEELRALKVMWNEISEEEHARKLALPSRKDQAAKEQMLLFEKEKLISKKYDELSLVEKKVLFGIALTNEELDSLKS